DFQILKTEHFDIYYYQQEREGIDVAARLAERWRVRLGRILAHELRGRQPLVLYASHPDFEQTNAIYGELGESTGGVTEPLRRRILGVRRRTIRRRRDPQNAGDGGRGGRYERRDRKGTGRQDEGALGRLAGGDQKRLRADSGDEDAARGDRPVDRSRQGAR